MNKKIMILGGSILQLPAIEKARELGLETVVVDMNPKAIGFEVDGIQKEIISTIDVPAIVNAAKRHRIDGIMTLATDMPMRAVAAVAKEMNLIGIDEETALKATNKAIMRKALKKWNVPIPLFFKVTNKKEYMKIATQFNIPFMVKPADSSGSRGIFKVDDISNTKMIEEAYDYCHPYSRCGDVIVEEYMQGPEVSVETIAIDGECHVIQITDKLTTGAPHYVEIGHSQPTILSKKVVEEIEDITKAANKAIGISNGPSHTEIIVTNEGPKIVEIGARLGGDNINTHLVPLSTGINIVECCIMIALGEKINIQPKINRGAAIRYFRQHRGIIKRIEGVERASTIRGVEQIKIIHGVGDTISDIIDSGSRMGYIISSGKDAFDAINSCNKAMNEIIIDIS